MRKKAESSSNNYILAVLDDDIGVIDTLSTILGKQGYTVFGFTEPAAALDALRNRHFDMLILDYFIGVTKGSEFVQKVREFDKELYILLLTGYKDMVPPIETIKKLDIQAYCEKGADFEQLLLLVESGVKYVNQMQAIKIQNLQSTLQKLEQVQGQLEHKERLAEIGQLAAGVAHEINNPLGFVSSNLGALREYVAKIKQMLDAYRVFNVSVRKNLPDELIEKLQYIESLESKGKIDFIASDINGLLNDVNEGLERITRIVAALKDFTRPDEVAEAEAEAAGTRADKVAGCEAEATVAKAAEVADSEAEAAEVADSEARAESENAGAKAAVSKADKVAEVARVTAEASDVGRASNASREDRADGQRGHSLYDINHGVENALLIANNEIKYHAAVEKLLGDVPAVMANGVQIEQVLLNILVNAAHAIRSKDMGGAQPGLIRIRTYYDESFVYCEISDNGIGMKAEVQSRAFEPFFTTKPAGQGMGLGLSISRDIIVNRHKGELLVSSVYGVGTTFTVKLLLGRE